jgi:hypothetical protein
MRSLLRTVLAAAVFTSGAAYTAPAQTAQGATDGYVVVTKPRDWTGEGVRVRGLTVGKPMDVEGLVYHRSGIVRVTVNGQDATLSQTPSGVTRFVTTVAARARDTGVEVVAYPANGAAMTREYGRGSAVAAAQTAAPPPPAPVSPASAPEIFASGAATLRVSVAGLPSSARTSVASSLRAVPYVTVSSRERDPAHLTIRREENSFLVVGPDGAVRHTLPAPTPAAGAAALVPILREEVGARRLAEIAAPRGAAPLEFSFLRAKSSFRLNEPIELRLRAGRDGYLTVVDLGTNGTVTVLFPSELDRGNLVREGQVVTIPTAAMREGDQVIAASEPVGRGIVRAFLTPQPLEIATPAGEAVQAEAVIQALRAAIATAGSGSRETASLWTTSVLHYEITR